MSFAKKQMEKYGWKEGQGLGKNESGITTAIKPKLKNNNNGLGFDGAEEFTNDWWNSLYKKASDNISVTNSSSEVKISKIGKDSVEISNSEYKINKRNKKKGVEQSFVKTSKIVEGNVINYDNVVIKEEEKPKYRALTDEELFKACGGRTAHKGARHGFTLSGKLLRLQRQEKILLKQMRRISLNEEDKAARKLRKILEKLNTNEKLDKTINDEKLSKKKKKKNRKVVSFSETICKVIPETEADSSFNSEDRLEIDGNSAQELNHPSSPHSSSRSPSPNPDLFDFSPPHVPNLADEGIEQDCAPLNDEADDSNDHRSFEERSGRSNLSQDIQDLLYADRDLRDPLLSNTEKKLKLKKIRNTERFLTETYPIKCMLMDSFDDQAIIQKGRELNRLRVIQNNLKRKSMMGEETEDTDEDNMPRFNPIKKKRRQENAVNQIAKGLETVCTITENSAEEKKSKHKIK